MNSSFLYHAWGLYTHECTCEEYKGNRIILHVQAKERLKGESLTIAFPNYSLLFSLPKIALTLLPN